MKINPTNITIWALLVAVIINTFTIILLVNRVAKQEEAILFLFRRGYIESGQLEHDLDTTAHNMKVKP